MDKRIEEIKEYTLKPINDLGYDLYHIEYISEDDEMFLRFYIENKDKELAINFDDCEKVSRMVSLILDEKDPIEEQYFLEVSSPGLFRTLFTLDHMKDAVGEPVNVRLVEDFKGKKNYNAILVDVLEDSIIINFEEKEVKINIKDIKSMNLNPEI